MQLIGLGDASTNGPYMVWASNDPLAPTYRGTSCPPNAMCAQPIIMTGSQPVPIGTMGPVNTPYLPVVDAGGPVTVATSPTSAAPQTSFLSGLSWIVLAPLVLLLPFVIGGRAK